MCSAPWTAHPPARCPRLAHSCRCRSPPKVPQPLGQEGGDADNETDDERRIRRQAPHAAVAPRALAHRRPTTGRTAGVVSEAASGAVSRAFAGVVANRCKCCPFLDTLCVATRRCDLGRPVWEQVPDQLRGVVTRNGGRGATPVGEAGAARPTPAQGSYSWTSMGPPTLRTETWLERVMALPLSSRKSATKRTVAPPPVTVRYRGDVNCRTVRPRAPTCSATE